MQDIPELTPSVAEAVVGFMRRELPGMGPEIDQDDRWDGIFCSAYQTGFLALVALGQADKTAWGAEPKAAPSLPAALPLWEDIAVAVLGLAEQHGQIEYHEYDGGQRVPNIAEGPGTGPAWASDDVLLLLETLGLVRRNAWTEPATPVHWREPPHEWRLWIEEEDRFILAVERAVETMPKSVRADIDALVVFSAPQGAAQLRQSLISDREHSLDSLFFQRWRIGRGWLDEDQLARALDIHDHLGREMRRAVMAWLYPGGFIWE